MHPTHIQQISSKLSKVPCRTSYSHAVHSCMPGPYCQSKEGGGCTEILCSACHSFQIFDLAVQLILLNHRPHPPSGTIHTDTSASGSTGRTAGSGGGGGAGGNGSGVPPPKGPGGGASGTSASGGSGSDSGSGPNQQRGGADASPTTMISAAELDKMLSGLRSSLDSIQVGALRCAVHQWHQFADMCPLIKCL